MKRLLLSCLLGFASCSFVQADLFDDFTGYPEGAVNGAGTEWVQLPSYTTAPKFLTETDGNMYLHLEGPSYADTRGAYRPLGGTLEIADTNTATTLFCRFYTESDSAGANFGLTDVAAPGSVSDYEVEVVITNTTIAIETASGTVGSTTITSGQWYNAWVVVDQSTDTYELYVTPEADNVASVSDLVASGSFVSGTTDPLVTFLSFADNGSFGNPVRLDDINISSGSALVSPTYAGATNPSPENAATSVGLDIDLNWDCAIDPETETRRSDISTHYLYVLETFIGDDDPNMPEEAVMLEVADTGTDPLVVLNADLPIDLKVNKLYYWYVVEGIDYGSGSTASDPNNLQGPLWSFDTSTVPDITAGPDSTGAFDGEPASFTVEFMSFTTPQVQWFKGETAITTLAAPAVDNGDNTFADTLNLTAVGIDDEGDYYCVIENNDGSTTSENAALVIKRKLAHWMFEEDTTDSSDNAADATGTDITYAAGTDNMGMAASFNGTTSLATVPEGFDNFSQGITICVWANPDVANNWARFIDFANGSGQDNILFSRSGTGATLSFQLWNGTTNSSMTADNAIVLNEWQFFCATADNEGNAAIYKNGIALNTATLTLPSVVSRTINYIGDSNWESDALYSGLMDDLRIYNYGLTETEIADLYIESVGFFCQNPPAFDFNGDCIVNLADISDIAASWLECGLYPSCDQ